MAELRYNKEKLENHTQKGVLKMDFFDKLGNTISAAGKTGLSKAKEIKDTARITLDIQEREGAIRKLYQNLGQAYYQAHKDDENPEYEQIAEIRAAFEEIGELKSAKDDIRGIRRCPECGGAVADSANFRSNCGAKCEKPEPEVYEGEVVDSEEEAAEETTETEAETDAEDAPVAEEAFEDEDKTEE